ncbi:MAG: VPLPA-CTERM sorting domain-containing protein [Litoreibacter sp.]|nr:VPLPA-CTERM sorting domain-containing protein [Litoreibacter sp.]
MKTAIGAAVLAASLTFGGATTASVVHGTLDFAGHGGLKSSHTVSDGYLSVEATGHLLNSDGSLGTQERIGQYGSYTWGTGGFGVTNDDETKKTCSGWGWWKSCKTKNTDSHQIDNHKNDEAVKLSFDKEVTITKVFFSYVDKWDDFSFSVFDGLGGVTEFTGRVQIDKLGYGGYYEFAPGSFAASSMFAFGAFKDNKHDLDGFKLRGVKYAHEVPEVPLPACGALLLTVLAGIGFLRSRKKTA